MWQTDINNASRPGATHSTTLDMSTKSTMMKRSLNILTFLLASSMGAALAAPPGAPTGVCIEHAEGVECAATNTTTATSSSGQAGVFPGTNLKFYPGFIIAGTEGESASAIEARWQKLFTASPDRKTSYRPKGIYGGVAVRLNWNRFYVNQSVRPKNPKDHKDPAYDWSKLDAVFAINAVQNEDALVFIEIGDISYSSTPKAPSWLGNAPYNGIFLGGTDGGSGEQKTIPKYYRYAGPDLRDISTDTNYPIVEEWVNFHQAMYDHLVATGNINKVMLVSAGGEAFPGANFTPPTDWNLTNYRHGIALRIKLIAETWAESNIMVNAGNLTGEQKTLAWPYVSNPLTAVGRPDMKLNGTDNIGGEAPPTSRYTDLEGVHQKDTRPLKQATEGNGQRANTYFAPGVSNPWGYNGVTVPQTMSHVLWVLSGSPKGANKDSGLGQVGDDPAGLVPVHQVVMDFNRSWQDLSPDVSEWHKAIDTFGPPGTFAFPYLPPGYAP